MWYWFDLDTSIKIVLLSVVITDFGKTSALCCGDLSYNGKQNAWIVTQSSILKESCKVQTE